MLNTFHNFKATSC